MLQDASHPLDAASIAQRFDMHITTARFHLDQLERAALVRREVLRGGQRGRPRITFAAVRSMQEADSQRQLNSVLADALANDDDSASARAHDAGERWSEMYALDIDATPDAPEGAVARIFDKIGFEPEPQTDGSETVIALHACPFRDAAVAYPHVVCAAHRGLLDGIMRRGGDDAHDATLLPFVEAELCLVRIRSSPSSD